MDTRRISGATPQKVADLGQAAGPVKNAKKSSKKVDGDFNVQLSDDAMSKQAAQAKAFNIAKNTPAVREDKVADIQKRIADGTYKVDSEKIADGMIKEAVTEHMSQNRE